MGYLYLFIAGVLSRSEAARGVLAAGGDAEVCTYLVVVRPPVPAADVEDSVLPSETR